MTPQHNESLYSEETRALSAFSAHCLQGFWTRFVPELQRTLTILEYLLIFWQDIKFPWNFLSVFFRRTTLKWSLIVDFNDWRVSLREICKDQISGLGSTWYYQFWRKAREACVCACPSLTTQSHCCFQIHGLACSTAVPKALVPQSSL